MTKSPKRECSIVKSHKDKFLKRIIVNWYIIVLYNKETCDRH
jgi:hypothetical protein